MSSADCELGATCPSQPRLAPKNSNGSSNEGRFKCSQVSPRRRLHFDGEVDAKEEDTMEAREASLMTSLKAGALRAVALVAEAKETPPVEDKDKAPAPSGQEEEVEFPMEEEEVEAPSDGQEEEEMEGQTEEEEFVEAPTPKVTLSVHGKAVLEGQLKEGHAIYEKFGLAVAHGESHNCDIDLLGNTDESDLTVIMESLVVSQGARVPQDLFAMMASPPDSCILTEDVLPPQGKFLI